MLRAISYGNEAGSGSSFTGLIVAAGLQTDDYFFLSFFLSFFRHIVFYSLLSLLYKYTHEWDGTGWITTPARLVDPNYIDGQGPDHRVKRPPQLSSHLSKSATWPLGWPAPISPVLREKKP